MYTEAALGIDPYPRLAERAEYYREAERQHALAGADLDRAWDVLHHGWVLEQLGRGAQGIDRGRWALDQFRVLGCAQGVGEAQHGLAIWMFHASTDLGPVESAFLDAAKARESIGELLLAAQSWHNLGYTQLVSGRAESSWASYERAAELLDRVRTGGDEGQAQSALRQMGFILSHRSYWMAIFRGPAEAIEASAEYFQHEAETGRPKEPALAHLALGLALRDGLPSGTDLRTIPKPELGADPWAWIGRAVVLADPAQGKAPGARKRPYLGVYLRATSGLAALEAAQGRPEQAESILWDGAGRAWARGWPAEVERLGAGPRSVDTLNPALC